MATRPADQAASKASSKKTGKTELAKKTADLSLPLTLPNDPDIYASEAAKEKDKKHDNLRWLPHHEDADGYLPEKRLGFYISKR